MIHLVGILLVSGGVSAAGILPKVKKDIKKHLKKMFSDSETEAETVTMTPLITVSSEKNELILPAETELAASDKPAKIQIEEEEDKYRFALSTGTMGLATLAQLGVSVLTPVSLVMTGFLSARIFQNSVKAVVEEKRISVDILDSTVISLCLVFNQIAPAAMMVWVLDLAGMLLDRTTKKSSQYLTDIFGEQVQSAWIPAADGQEVEVPVVTLKAGDIIIVITGGHVPVDGIVTEGEAMIDQHSLTGEAAPVEKRVGDEVFAMTVLVAGKIRVRVRDTGENTLASKILRIINDASAHKVRLHSVGEKIADDMVIPTLGLGALGYAVTGTNAMLAIINADYGTGIRIAAPIALMACLGIAAKNGVLIKDSKVLELLKDIDVVLFDKTGTLTYDVPVVSEIVPADGTYSAEKILLYTAAAEQKFSHPIAKAILRKAAEGNIELPPHDESRYHVGLGIEVAVHGDTVKVGSARYIERENIIIPQKIRDALEKTADKGHTAILTAVNGNLAGMLELQSALRDEAFEVVSLLRTKSIKEIVLISGDHDAPTKALSDRLGADRYFAGVLPHEKADYVKLLQNEGKKVMMVGDGINDSAALSYADISVSLQGASTVAVDVADVIFMDGTLKNFEYLFEVSDILHRNVRRSFLMIAVPNTVCILGALMGVFGLASSLVLNNGFNLLAAANGMLPYTETGSKDTGVEYSENVQKSL